MSVLWIQPLAQSDSLMISSFVTFKTGTLWKSYAKANPIESKGIDEYWMGGARPPLVRTATGKALLGWADSYRGF